MEILKEQPTEQKPYIVDNYPYGFRLRTKIKYYVETTKNGQRFVSRTLNPKTNLWNKPKKSTYDQIILIGLEDNTKYVRCVRLSTSYRTEAEAVKFFEKYGEYFSEYQKTEFKGIIGLLKVLDKVEFEINVRRFKHKITGEITESANCMEINNYVEVDKEGNEINTEAKAKQQEELNRNINKLAVLSAKQEQGSDIDTALNTFKRA
jgi:hypothetical protein